MSADPVAPVAPAPRRHPGGSVAGTIAERGYLAGRASIARQLRMPVPAAFEDFDVWEYTVAFVGSGWPGVPFIESDGYYAGCAPV